MALLRYDASAGLLSKLFHLKLRFLAYWQESECKCEQRNGKNSARVTISVMNRNDTRQGHFSKKSWLGVSSVKKDCYVVVSVDSMVKFSWKCWFSVYLLLAGIIVQGVSPTCRNPHALYYLYYALYCLN